MKEFTRFFISVLLVSSCSVSAQIAGSVHTPTPFNLLSPMGSCIAPNGNIYVLGRYQGALSEDVYLSCSNISGSLLWERVNYCNATDESAFAIDADDNSIYVSGFFVDTGSNVANGFIMRFRSDGSLAWQYHENPLNIFALRVTKDGGVVAINFETIIKLDTSGNILWAKELMNEDSTFLSFDDICVNQNDEIYCVGTTTISNISRGIVIKLNGDGAVVWSKYYTNLTGVFSNVSVLDDKLYVLGWTSYVPPGFNSFLLQFDTSGAFIRGVITDLSDSMTYVWEHIEISPYNTIIASGGQQNLVTMERRGNISEFDRDSLFVLRTLSQTGVTTIPSNSMHSNGTTVLSSQVNYSIASYAWQFGCGFYSDSIAFYPTTVSGTPIGMTTTNVSLIGSTGNVASITIPWTICSTSVAIQEQESTSVITASPNPCSQHCTVLLPSPFHDFTNFSITDINGKPVGNVEMNIGIQEVQINTSNLSNGMYFLQSENRILAKIVVAH